ncbi:hypothetical protein CAPTEDRAFT_206885 [Capitella teleta]|uniref:LRRCT domain-containing protein n=1 Tax=Capitella teleta TaxID=283909 RepID=R7UGA8_CAPTE|nr:hypothetical protein CAPTEDRAFT_206885 [Capitella teleta]|eukprot:ELU05255.1 hypothetical protein CAPTEDRAFT_206885 [Capitella teleta]
MDNLRCVLWIGLFLIYVVPLRVHCEEHCPEGCTCRAHDSQQHAVCTGFSPRRPVVEPTLSHIVSKLPQTITHLLMRYEKFEDGDLNDTLDVFRLTQLQVLLLDQIKSNQPQIHQPTPGFPQRHRPKPVSRLKYTVIKFINVTRQSLPKNLRIFHSQVALNLAADAFAALHELESLGLSRGRTTFSFLPHLFSQSLCNTTSLKRLILTDDSSKVLFSSIFSTRRLFAGCRMTSVQELDLSRNRIGTLKSGLLDTFPNLKILIIAHNLLGHYDAIPGSIPPEIDFRSIGKFYGQKDLVDGVRLLVETIYFSFYTLKILPQGRNIPEMENFTEKDLFKTVSISQPILQCNLPSVLSFGCLSVEMIAAQNLEEGFGRSTYIHLSGHTSSKSQYNSSGINVNAIWRLRDSLFNGVSTASLKHLNLQMLDIPVQFLNALQDIPLLETALLGGNPRLRTFIENFTHGALNLPNLKSFDLANTNITILHDSFFMGLPSLEYLNLSGNHLREFRVNLSPCPRLQMLNLSKNSISELSSPWPNIVNSNLTIDLSGNPLMCGCLNLDFLAWFQETSPSFHDVEKLTCLHPFYGKHLESTAYEYDTVSLNGHAIQWVESARHLGNMIDTKLTHQGDCAAKLSAFYGSVNNSFGNIKAPIFYCI